MIIVIFQLFVFQGYEKIHKFIACQGKHSIARTNIIPTSI